MNNLKSVRKWRTRIKLLREKLNWTQEQLAQEVGVSWATVARWEMKKGSAPSNMAKRQLENLEQTRRAQRIIDAAAGQQ